jgi:hypothetical protein
VIAHLAIRLALILLGYGLACIASAVVVGCIYSVAENERFNQLPGIIAFTTMLIAIYAALPAGFTVGTSEIMRLQAKWHYLLAATLIGAVLPVIVGLPHWYILVGIGFGPVAGLIYWVIAGRSAGFRLRNAAA